MTAFVRTGDVRSDQIGCFVRFDKTADQNVLQVWLFLCWDSIRKGEIIKEGLFLFCAINRRHQFRNDDTVGNGDISFVTPLS